MNRKLRDLEIVEDRSEQLGPKQGFLQLARLVLVNHYEDGSRSEPYPCDVVSRRHVDAVTIVLYERCEDDRLLVGLRENLRAPIWLRRRNPRILFADEPRIDTLLETVAGVLEPDDVGEGLEAALDRRAAEESQEEVGMRIDPAAILPLGGASFPTPGIGDEKVYFRAVEVRFAEAGKPSTDGSVMEELGGLVVLPLEEALERCRDGRIPDMKTEIALGRLRDRMTDAGTDLQ